MDDWSAKEERGGTLRRSKRLPAKRRHQDDSFSVHEVEKKRSKELISSSSSSSVTRARPSTSQFKTSVHSNTSTIRSAESSKSSTTDTSAGSGAGSVASKSRYNLRPRTPSNLSATSALSTRKRKTTETGQASSSRSEAAAAGAESSSGTHRRTRNPKPSATTSSAPGIVTGIDSQARLQTRGQRRSTESPATHSVCPPRDSHLSRGRSASQPLGPSTAAAASKQSTATRVRASGSFTSRLFRHAEPAKASGSSVVAGAGTQPLAPLRNSASAPKTKTTGDLPEPEGLRRSHRFREATGSCASSSSRRGSQTKKRTWTRHQSPSMSTDDGTATQASTSAQRSDEAGQGTSGSGGGGTGGDSESGPDDGDLSRLQALLEARGLPPHLFGSLGPRMHQLLHRTISGSSVSKAQQLLSGIQSSSDEGQQLQSVIEMCQLLVMGNEETLGGFPVKQAVPALINLLSMEHNFDMMNHACRALTYLMEALPRSTAVVVDAIPVFLEKLQVIQCMDVAEQSLTALEMLSRRHGKAILQAGGLSACLLYLDFFSISAQRSALAIASNCCHNLNLDEFHFVAESIAILSGRLQHQDKKSVESCCLAFTRLVDNFQNDENYDKTLLKVVVISRLSKKRLKELAAHGLLSNLQQLLVVSPPVISTGTFVMVLRMLAIMCANCPSLGVQLLKQNIADTLRYLLMGTTELGEEELVELVPRSPQEFYEITYLISELMPNLPSDGLFSVDSLLSNTPKGDQGLWQWRDDRGVWHSYSWIDSRIIEAAHQSGEDELSLTTMGRTYTVDFNTMQQINEDTGTTRPVQRRPAASETCTLSSQASISKKEDERALLLQEDTELVSSFTTALFAVLYEIYNSSVGPAVRHRCINAILRMIYYTPPDLLSVILKKHPISSLISGMLGSNDLRVLVNAIQMAEILMQKLPDIFHVYFRREGVMHRAKDLANSSLNGPVALGKELANSSSSETISNDPRTSDLLPGRPRFDSLPSPPPTRRLGDMLKRKRRSKRVGRPKGKCPNPTEESPVCAKKYPNTDSSPSKSLSLPSASSFQSSKPSFFPSLTSSRWSTRSSSSSLGSASSERSKIEMNNSGILLSSSQTSDNREKAKAWVKEQAAKFCTAYFDQERGTSHPALEILNRLSTAADELVFDKDTGLAPLKEINKVLSTSDDGASAFEILHSGFVPKLLRYVTCATAEDTVSVDLRLKRFLHIFLDCPEPSVTGSSVMLRDSHEKPSLVALVQKLHLCINQLEQFPVKVHDAPGATSGAAGSRGSQTLKFFNTHQIKCHLQRHPNCHTLKRWKGGPVKIDPLALVQAIEKYLVVRGYSRVREQDVDEDGSDDDGSEDEIDETLATELQGNNPRRHEIEILLGDRVLPYNMTVYQAVKQFGHCDEERDADEDHGVLGRPSIWVATHTIWYRQVSETTTPTAGGKKTRSDYKSAHKNSPKTKVEKAEHTTRAATASVPLNGKLSACRTDNFSISDPSLEVICLMRVLFTLNMQWSVLYEVGDSRAIVSCNEFVNHKLTAKVLRQLQDPIIVMTGNFPAWLNELAKSCPFLFPFECRQQLFFCTAFDRDRAMGKLQETVPDLMNTDGTDRVTPRLDRKKRTVTRKDLFSQAETIINDLGSSRSILEIQYEGEVGTGLGPTLEFYALASKAFQRADLEMWRGEATVASEGSDVGEGVLYVHSPTGLFPAPLPKNAKVGSMSKLRSRFRFLGKFMAKAMTDFRMVDIPLSKAFYKWMLGHDTSLGYRDLQYVDPLIYKTINQLQEVVKQKKRLEQDPSHTPESRELAQDNLTLDGVTIEDLGLDFVLPGYPNIELKKSGKEIPVTIYNLEEYIRAVVNWTLIEGVSRQFQAFREGFDSVFQLSNLSSFYPHEMDLLLCGASGEKWDVRNLMESCRPDHGYTHDSRAVKYLFEILSSYSTEEQRLFLQFVTGSPRLPVGGFRSLNPPLTIVRKTFEAPLCADSYLPSVMTCVNYLKLPDYSSKEIMEDKLKLAAMEGQRSFHLS